MPRSPIVKLITTTSPVSRYHSLSLWIITLKCPLSSFNPWLQAPSVVMVFRGRRGDVWWWAVTCCIRSSRLMYLVRPVATVCRRWWSWWSCWVPVVENQVQFHHRCALLGLHQKKKVHPSLIWTILTTLLLVQNITIITVITDSDRVI